ncbi:MAG: allantoinase, partial [Actinobacteria bacterium]|nr:allantoinase [Actinomycetota bacterium]
MSGYDLIIRAPAAMVAGEQRHCGVAVRGGRIAAVLAPGVRAAATQVVDLAPDEVLLPGLVDSHVHINEPG